MRYLKCNIETPINFSNCGEFTSDSGWMHMERRINNYELIIMKKGIVYIQQDSDKYILNEGNILLIEPCSLHKGFDFSPKGTEFYWVHFSPSNEFNIIDSSEALNEISLAHNNPYFNGLNSSILIPSLSSNLNLDRIEILFHQLLHLSQSNYYTDQSSNYILTSLLIELSEQVISKSTSNNQNDASKNTLSKIIQWINNHLTQGISLKDAAYEFNFSKEYLARYFKKNMGMSMQEYINYLRISQAKKLLISSDLNIKEISHKLGFADEKYFLKLFKKYENITPKQFKNAYSKTFINNV